MEVDPPSATHTFLLIAHGTTTTATYLKYQTITKISSVKFYTPHNSILIVDAEGDRANFIGREVHSYPFEEISSSEPINSRMERIIAMPPMYWQGEDRIGHSLRRYFDDYLIRYLDF